MYQDHDTNFSALYTYLRMIGFDFKISNITHMNPMAVKVPDIVIELYLYL
jgi:hypothetical protein